MKYPVSRLDPEKLARYNHMKENNTGPLEDLDAICNEVLQDIIGKILGVAKKPRPNEMPSTSLATTSTPFVSPSTSYVSTSTSFESLLLQKINRTVQPKKKRRKVDTRAKVITSEEWLKLASEQSKRNKQKEKEKNAKGKRRKLKLGEKVKKDLKTKSNSKKHIKKLPKTSKKLFEVDSSSEDVDCR